jgi:hypothetical protein
MKILDGRFLLGSSYLRLQIAVVGRQFASLLELFGGLFELAGGKLQKQ